MDFLQRFIVDFFQRAHPVVQGGVLAAMLAVYLVLVWLIFRNRYKYHAMRNERDRFRLRYDEQRLQNQQLDGRNNQLSVQVQNLQSAIQKSEEEKGRLEQQQENANKEISKLSEERDHFRYEWQTLQERMNRLQEIDASIWYNSDRDVPTTAIPAFVPLGNRRTRFVSFINLKGGVGKTTLVANLAAAFATEIIGEPLRVLVVDLDFQGTLSNRCVTRELLAERRKQQHAQDPFSRNTSHRLLEANFLDDDAQDIINLLRAPISETNEKGWAIVASEILENADFRHQAQFVMQEKEVRFQHRKIFHSNYVFETYDLVFFDCPPRVTTSAVNALTASDYVVLPTSLHPEDTEAIPRTLRWLENLRALPTFTARPAAVILNRTYRGGTMDEVTNDEKPILQSLRNNIQQHVGECIIPAVIRNHPKVAQYAAGHVPLGTTPEGHELYQAVATELYDRLRR